MNLHRKYNNTYFWLFIKILFSAALLTYLFTTIPVKHIFAVIEAARLSFVMLGLVITIPINYLSAYQTHYLTKVQHMTISVLQILKIHLVTSYYGLFLPGVLSGGAIKWYKFSKFGTGSSAAAVVLLNRFIETFITVLIGLVFLIPGLYASDNKNLLSLLIIIFCCLMIIYYLLFNKTVNAVLTSILYKFPSPKIMKNKAHSFLIAMYQFRILSFKDHIGINGIVFFYNLLGTFAFYCFARAILIDLDIFTLGWIRSALALISLLPFSFAGLGLREGSLVILLNQYGVNPESAMALSFLVFLRTLLNAAAGGILEMIPFPEKRKHSLMMKSADDI